MAQFRSGTSFAKPAEPRSRGHQNMQRLPGLPESPGWVWDKHPTAGRRRRLLLGTPDVEGGMFLGGFGRAGLPGVALRWWRQRHLLLCLFCRLRCCPPRRPAALEELTWALSRPPYHARRPTPPPCRPCRGRRRVKGQGLSTAGRRERHRERSGRSTVPPRGQVQKSREPQVPQPRPSPRLRRSDPPTGHLGNCVP